MSEPVAIAIALIAIAGPLFGVWVGWKLGRAERDEQWRRDQQIEAYSMLTAANVNLALVGVDMLDAKGDDERRAGIKRLNEATVQHHNAENRAVIVASPSIQSIIDNLHAATRVGLEGLHEKAIDRDRVTKAFEEAAEIRKQVSTAARADLGFRRGS